MFKPVNVEQLDMGDDEAFVSMTYLFTLTEEMPEARLSRIVGDIEELGADLKTFIPEKGTVVSFSFLTDCGLQDLPE